MLVRLSIVADPMMERHSKTCCTLCCRLADTSHPENPQGTCSSPAIREGLPREGSPIRMVEHGKDRQFVVPFKQKLSCVRDNPSPLVDRDRGPSHKSVVRSGQSAFLDQCAL